MRSARPWHLGVLLCLPLLLIGCGNSYVAEENPACNNQKQDSGETDVDCGGPNCPGCAEKKRCTDDSNCSSGLVCAKDVTDPNYATEPDKAKRCIEAHCTDRSRNLGETDTDCGGSCFPCVAGQKCKKGADCESRVCTEGVCVLASCSDGMQNQDESDVDCGSLATATTCPRCSEGLKCSVDENCESDVCKSSLCLAPTCNDSHKNGDEGGVDCGGSCTTRCNQGSACNKDADCTSNVCRGNTCQSAECGDGVHNGDESDVDCGGSCTVKCPQNAGCNGNADCVTEFCNQNVCQAPTCDDGIANQLESDVDCGDLRGLCKLCGAGQRCTYPTSCASYNCTDGRCVERSCFDFIKNGTESDTDCGGECTAKCKDTQFCREMRDCESSVCTEKVCVAARCGDGVENGQESDVDCGGSVCTEKCDLGLACNINSDCKINSCSAGKCSDPSCANSTKDGTETDMDCGGDRCAPCTDAKQCTKDSDCSSKHCVNLACVAASCEDRILNGRETALDCGGDCAKKCDVGQACSVSTDCRSGVCSGGLCKAPACDDLVKNGLETDVDCGGPDCTALTVPRLCAKTQGCQDDSDCKAKLVCDAASGKCVDWSCSDLRKNQDETDVDCGGIVCPGCGTDKVCLAPSDCKDRICASNRCVAPSCIDETKNGNEGDKDCGGNCTKKCEVQQFCNAGTDCVSGVCAEVTPHTCLVPTCTDKVKNGTETDVDCGGSCSTKCADGKMCKVGTDCLNSPKSTCTEVGAVSFCTPPGCGDKIKNNDETDVDCGGSCSPCGVGLGCSGNADCAPIVSGKCVAGKCAAAACGDLVKNGAESDVDCGGSGAQSFPACSDCVDGKKCTVNEDCISLSCNGTCLPPTCTDGIKNGSEIAKDCGSACASVGKLCGNDSPCATDADCASGWCDARTATKACKVRSCTDGILNGAEGDVDCGLICGTTDMLCKVADGDSCKKDQDCDFGACSECTGKCIKSAKQCYMAADSGTGECARCSNGLACTADLDCLSLACHEKVGLCSDLSTLDATDPYDCYAKAAADSTCTDNCDEVIRCLIAYKRTITQSYNERDVDCGVNKLNVGQTPFDLAAAAIDKVAKANSLVTCP